MNNDVSYEIEMRGSGRVRGQGQGQNQGQTSHKVETSTSTGTYGMVWCTNAMSSKNGSDRDLWTKADSHRSRVRAHNKHGDRASDGDSDNDSDGERDRSLIHVCFIYVLHRY